VIKCLKTSSAERIGGIHCEIKRRKSGTSDTTAAQPPRRRVVGLSGVWETCHWRKVQPRYLVLAYWCATRCFIRWMSVVDVQLRNHEQNIQFQSHDVVYQSSFEIILIPSVLSLVASTMKAKNVTLGVLMACRTVQAMDWGSMDQYKARKVGSQ
jgi:hypothetical protein